MYGELCIYKDFMQTSVKDVSDAKSSVILLIMHVRLPAHSRNIIINDVK